MYFKKRYKKLSVVLVLVLLFSSLSAGAAFGATTTPLSCWAWGNNENGQLGDGTKVNKSNPTQTGTDTDWAAVSTGGFHTVALKENGTLWAWGENGYGALGDGTKVDKSNPTQIGTATDWAAVSAGSYHTLALKTDGTLWAWGENGYGALGDGSTTDKSSPTQIGADTWKAVSAGNFFSLAIKSDNTLWAWGWNLFGELGLGYTSGYDPTTSPTQVGTDNGWAAVSAGSRSNHVLAQKIDGTLWAWGRNDSGQLGDGTQVDKYSPTQVELASDWAAVSAGGQRSLALKTDGTLWAWGNNDWGQLGDGTTVSKSSPTQVGTADDWAAAVAGYYHTLALKPDGRLYTWGWNGSGQLGDGTQVDKSSPNRVGAGITWRMISGGYRQTLALATAGSAATVLSVDTVADINVATGTALADVGLPATVGVTLSDGTTTALDVTWDGGAPAYDSGTAGTYAFTGTLSLTAGITNPGILTASVNVCVAAASVPICTIGDVQYITLDEALAAVRHGDTIKLLTNIDYTTSTGIEINGKTITFDLNGYALNATNLEMSGVGLYIYNGGEIKLEGMGQFNVTAELYAVAVQGGKVAVTNVTAIGAGGIGCAGVVANGADTVVEVRGDVIAENQGRAVFVDNGARVYVHGDITSETSVFAAGATVIVEGNLTADEGPQAKDGGEITINGVITAATYILIGNAEKVITEGVPGTGEYKHYLIYTDGTSTVRVYDPTYTNNPPTAKSPVPAQSMTVGSLAGFTASEIAQDADGDTLIITAIVTNPEAGMAGASLSGDTVIITGLSTGSTSVVVQVSDGTDTVDVTVPITVNPAPVPPTITTQPSNRTVTAGQTASFTVGAGGDTPLSYQWKKDGSDLSDGGNISGAITAILTITNAQKADEGSYTCYVSNAAGDVTSSAATLTVIPAPVPPFITSQPVDQTVREGKTANFTVAALGDPPLSYQWKKDGSDLSDGGNILGSNTIALSITNAKKADEGSYTCYVSNAAGNVTSSAAFLTVNQVPVPPFITSQPSNQTVTEGQTASFTVAALGDPPLSYQWKKDGSDLSDGGNILGSNTIALTITNAKKADEGSYTCYVSNAAGNVTSSAATLTVKPAPVPPTITSQPSNQTVTEGETASFTVAALGDAPLSYQWKKDGSDLSDGGHIFGVGTANLTITSAQKADEGSYTCYVSNAAGNVTSSSATLTVSPELIVGASIAPATVTFDKNPANQADVSTTITWNGAASITDIKHSGMSVGIEVYTVIGNILTIKKDYLITQSVSSLALGIEFDRGESVTLTVNILDTTPTGSNPPTWPAGSSLTASGTTNTRTTLNWTAAADDLGVTGYRIFQDQSLIRTVPATVYSAKVTGLSPAASYTFMVQAGDADDNWTDGPTVTICTNPSSGSGGGGGSATKPNSEAHLLNSIGNITERITLRMDNRTKTVAVKVNAASLTSAYESSTTDVKGVKTVVVNIPVMDGAMAYESTLPASFLSAGDTSRAVEIRTGVASVTVPGNMLTAADAKGAQNISLTIAIGDKSRLEAAVRAQIGDRPVIKLSLQINGQESYWSNAGTPATVTLPYMPTAEELANPECITVWYIDSKGNAAAVPNGRYDPQTGRVTFATTHFSYYAVVYVTQVFDDLGSTAWAKKPIEVLAAKGILRGNAENKYSPQVNITREDFLYFLVRTLGIDAKVDGNFADVSSDAYYYKEIGIAKKLGITNGTGKNKFGVGASITRQDMMALTEKALKLMNKLNQQGEASDLDIFADKAQIAPYAINSVASMVKEGLIMGDNGKINPQGNTTRAEAAVLLYRIYNR